MGDRARRRIAKMGKAPNRYLMADSFEMTLTRKDLVDGDRDRDAWQVIEVELRKRGWDGGTHAVNVEAQPSPDGSLDWPVTFRVTRGPR